MLILLKWLLAQLTSYGPLEIHKVGGSIIPTTSKIDFVIPIPGRAICVCFNSKCLIVAVWYKCQC